MPRRLRREFVRARLSQQDKAPSRAKTQPNWRLLGAPGYWKLPEHSKVSKPSGGPIALIVDDDLGFVWWLGERFHEVGYCPAPALNPRQAGSLLKELNLKITVVVVNPGLPGAQRLMKTLSRTQSPRVKIIIIRDPSVPTTAAVRAHAIVERPLSLEPTSRHEWLRKLRRILGHGDQTVSITKVTGHPPKH